MSCSSSTPLIGVVRGMQVYGAGIWREYISEGQTAPQASVTLVTLQAEGLESVWDYPNLIRKRERPALDS